MRETLRSKDAAFSALGGELGSLKVSNNKEVESLWGVVNKLDALDCAKDTALREVKEERDSARGELARLIQEVSNCRKIAASHGAERDKYRDDAKKLKAELHEIDAQLIECAENEGIDVLELIKH